MDKRVFLVLLLAGCADTTVNAPLAPSTPVAPPPAVSTPAAPTQPSAVTAVETGGQVAAFNAWLADFKPRAVAAGVPQAVVDRELDGLTPNPRVISLDGRQPEFSKPVGDYIKGVISDDRVAVGRAKRDSLPFLPTVESRYGVPRDILLASGRWNRPLARSRATSTSSARWPAWPPTAAAAPGPRAN